LDNACPSENFWLICKYRVGGSAFDHTFYILGLEVDGAALGHVDFSAPNSLFKAAF
jgi:hypothetical protein